MSETLGREPVNELMAALAKAQGEMSNAPFDATNPHFKSKYATLASIRDATIPHLAKHGLSIHQVTKINGDGMLLATRLAHSSGQWIESVYPLPNSSKPHEMGSAITYARRYSWAAITGIAAEEDEDGNAAQEGARNGTKTLPALPARKSSAAAKRDGDWPALKAALADCQSAREVEKLRAEYRAEKYSAWNQDWRDVADEEFEKRLAEFSQGEDLKQTLQDSIEDPPEFHRLRDQMIERIQKADTEVELLVWKESTGFRRELASLPKPMQLAVRKAGATKLETLRGAMRAHLATPPAEPA
jgi:hypothetical protein